MDGVLIIDKPAGPTSHDVVARVRRATGWARVGHTGTLDPLATGVLPLVVGRATRLAQFFSASDKVYEADVRLGWATDTYDAQGQPIAHDVEARRAVPPRAEDLERVLDRFRGSYLQVAPPFSAKKIDGVRAYALARQGATVAMKQSPVTVYELACTGREDDRLKLRVHCSAGFYVRSFAHELGAALGVGAHLSALRRIRSGTFEAGAAVALDLVEREGPAAAGRVVPLDRLLASMPAVVVNEQGANRVRHGSDLRPQDLTSPDETAAERVRVVDAHGTLLAIASRSSQPGVLHPGVVVV